MISGSSSAARAWSIPNVLQAVGYDPEQVTGFAFGLGIERLCMRRHNITDIRYLYQERCPVLAPVLDGACSLNRDSA